TPGHFDSHSETYRPGVGFNIPFPTTPPPRPNWTPPRPNYQYSQPSYRPSRPTYSPSPAPAQPKPAPPKNTIVSKKKPAVNKLDMTNLALRSSAETDARQQVEAEKAKKLLDVDVTEQIKNAITQPGADPKMLTDWQQVMQNGGDTGDVDAFISKYGPTGQNALPSATLASLDLRQKFGNYGDALASGSLSD